MKKSAKFITCIILTALPGFAFAAQGGGSSALETAIARTDAQLAPAFSAALEQSQAAAIAAPAPLRGESRTARLIDITEQSTREDEVVSAYPGIYKSIPREENYRIIRVFGFKDPQGSGRRVEVYYTGGDWMRYGLTYFVTDAGQGDGRVKAYFIGDLSTADRENGRTAPKVDPFDGEKLAEFIDLSFLDADGNVQAGFNTVANPLP